MKNQEKQKPSAVILAKAERILMPQEFIKDGRGLKNWFPPACGNDGLEITWNEKKNRNRQVGFPHGREATEFQIVVFWFSVLWE